VNVIRYTIVKQQRVIFDVIDNAGAHEDYAFLSTKYIHIKNKSAKQPCSELAKRKQEQRPSQWQLPPSRTPPIAHQKNKKVEMMQNYTPNPNAKKHTHGPKPLAGVEDGDMSSHRPKKGEMEVNVKISQMQWESGWDSELMHSRGPYRGALCAI
jgi:hypothetical protein